MGRNIPYLCTVSGEVISKNKELSRTEKVDSSINRILCVVPFSSNDTYFSSNQSNYITFSRLASDDPTEE